MASIPNVTIKTTETGIIVTADSGFNEVWNGDDCFGYVKGPGEESFPLKMGKHEIVVYCEGKIVLRENVTIGAESEPKDQWALSLDDLIMLKALLAKALKKLEEDISEISGTNNV